MRCIYTKYMKLANKEDKKHDKICHCTLALKQELHIKNEKKEQTFSFL